MLSHTERGKAFQIVCRDALKQALQRDIDMEVPIHIGGIRPHFFDLATRERDVVAECKAFAFTASGNNPSAKITALREAAAYLSAIPGSAMRLLIMKEDAHPTRGETLGQYFLRLNAHHLQKVTVLEMHEAGGQLTCLHGTFQPCPKQP